MSQSNKLREIKVKVNFDVADVRAALAEAATLLEQRNEAVRLLSEVVDCVRPVLYDAKGDHRPALLDVLTRSSAPEYYANELTATVSALDSLIPEIENLVRRVVEDSLDHMANRIE